MKNGLNINLYRKVLWPINAIIFNLTKLVPFRDQKLWIFGSNSGSLYSDNSRYFFEYINKNIPDIKPIWISNNKSIVEDLKRYGYDAILCTSFKGFWISLRCGVAIYTHSLADFGHLSFVGGAKIVALWHGVGFKKIYNTSYDGRLRKLKRFLDSFFSWTYRDISMATSEYTKQQFETRFIIKKDSIYITGQPRNDILFNSLNRIHVCKNLKIELEKKIILYMPTYRNPRQGDILEIIIRDIISNRILNETLDKNNAVFIIKLHPLTPMPEVESNERFMIFDYKSINFNQELLGSADILITDYSSCFVDYSLLKRPVIFYVPDEEEYLMKSGQMDTEFFDIYKMCRAYNAEELACLIEKPKNVVANITNELFEDKTIENTCYSENVFNAIMNTLKNEKQNHLS